MQYQWFWFYMAIVSHTSVCTFVSLYIQWLAKLAEHNSNTSCMIINVLYGSDTNNLITWKYILFVMYHSTKCSTAQVQHRTHTITHVRKTKSRCGTYFNHESSSSDWRCEDSWLKWMHAHFWQVCLLHVIVRVWHCAWAVLYLQITWLNLFFFLLHMSVPH